MVDSFKTHLGENSFYTIQSEKDEFVNNDKAIMNAFIFSFVAMTSMINISKEASLQKIKTYFKQDKQLRQTSISDENNDVSLIIKIMAEKDFFKTPAVVNQITRFLVIMKQGTVSSVDEEIIRGWINAIKVDKLMLLPSAVKKRVKAFQDGGSLTVLAADLKDFAIYRNSNKMKDTEYYKIAKIVKYDTKKINAAREADTAATSSATATSVVTPITPDTPAATSVRATAPVVNAAPVVAVKKPQKVVPKKFDLTGVFADIAANNNSDLDDRWKINNINRNQMVVYALDKYIASWSVDSWKTTLEYLKKYTVDQNILQKAIFGELVTKYGARSENIDRLVKFSTSGVFDLFTKDSATKKLNDIFIYAVKAVVNKGETKNSISELEAYKKELEAFLKSPMARTHRSLGVAYGYKDTFAPVYYYLFFPDMAIENLLRAKAIFKNSDGSYSYQVNEPPKALFIELMNYYNVTPIDSGDALIKKLEYTSIKWADYSESDLVIIDKTLANLQKSDVKRYDELGIRIIKRYSTQTTNNPAWVRITDNVASAIDMDRLVMQMIPDYPRLEIGDTPTSTRKIILSRFVDLMKRRSLAISQLSDSQSYGNNSITNLISFLAYILSVAENAGFDSSQFKDQIGLNYADLVKKNMSSNRGFFISTYAAKVPNSDNVLAALISKEQQDEIDSAALTRSMTRDITGPISSYSDMSKENKKKVNDMLDAGSDFSSIFHIVDAALLGSLSTDYFTNNSDIIDAIKTIVNLKFDTSEYVDKILALPTAKENMSSYFKRKNTTHSDMTLINQLAKSKVIEDSEFSNYTADAIKNVSSYNSHLLTILVSKIDTDNFGKKEKIIIEKTMLHVDVNIKKQTKDYKEFMTTAQANYMSYIDADRDSAEKLFQQMSDNMKRRIAAAYLSNKDFASTARTALEGEASLIKPYEKLTDKRLSEILKYNNVSSEETKIATKHIKSFSTLDAYALANVDKQPIQELQISQNEKTPKELAQLTAEMHRTRRSNRHGPAGIIFKRSFDVAIPMQAKEHAEWIAKMPAQEIINPMYHGAGSIAASMILRYGFRVIKKGDASVTARMLGDGIYGAINIDKSAQYVGDSGYRKETKGYIFEMDAALGEKGRDYQVRGLGNDNIRSPEWCVFTPNSQFLILKAYEVEIVSSETISSILAANPPSVNVNESRNLLRFKTYLKEYTMNSDEIENYTTFTFINGLIPMSNKGGDYVEFEDFKSPDPKRITLEPSAYGPTIVIRGTKEQNDYLLTSPTDLIENHPEGFEEYLRYFNKIYA
jgi:hypothetical protein